MKLVFKLIRFPLRRGEDRYNNRIVLGRITPDEAPGVVRTVWRKQSSGVRR